MACFTETRSAPVWARSDAVPTIATADANGNVSNPGANVANYDRGADWNGLDGNVTTVGSAGATSFYGAFDMGGNVAEWIETVFTPTLRVSNGGWFSSADHNLHGLSGFSSWYSAGNI